MEVCYTAQDGGFTALLVTAGLQDSRTMHALLKCIALTSIPSRPMRSLPPANTIRSCRKVPHQSPCCETHSSFSVFVLQWVARRRRQEEIKAELLKEEYRNVHRERRDMALHDRDDQFRRHYAAVLKEAARREKMAQAIVAAREEEEARIRKLKESTRNIVES